MRIRLVVEIECRNELSYGALGKKPCSPEAVKALVKSAFSAPYAPKGVKVVKVVASPLLREEL